MKIFVIRLVLMIIAPISFLSASQPAFKEVYVMSRISSINCSSSAIRDGEFWFNFVDTNIPWGSRVNVLYGFQKSSFGRPQISDWADSQSLALVAKGAYSWGMFITLPVRAPGRFKYSQINFVFEVILPDGTKVYEKGNNSARGFFTADLESVPYDCPPRATTRMEIKTVIRN